MANESSTLFVVASAFGYFILAVLVGGALFFPRTVSAALAAVRRKWSGLRRRTGLTVAHARQGASGLSAQGRGEARYWLDVARRNRVWLVVAGVAILAPAVLALSFQHYVAIGGYEDSGQPTDPVILALLQGEHLVPPPPLPPEVFTTKEIEMIRPALGSASRNWELLDQDFRQRLLAVFQVMRRHGYELALLEGYRSPERQDYLASLGKHVTSAAAFQSYHQFGLAADCAFFLNGRILIDERDPWAMQGYKLYGEAAEAAGLTWGGRWRMMDFGHVELRRSGVLVQGK